MQVILKQILKTIIQKKAMHFLNEIQKVIEEDNPITFKDVLDSVIAKGWHLDTFRTQNKSLLNMSAWKGYMQLIAISTMLERKCKKEINSPPQYISSGQVMKFDYRLDSNTCDLLEDIANQYHTNMNKEPLTLKNAENEYGLNDWEAVVKDIILHMPKCIKLKSLPESYKRLNVITPRCLLRRTYPQEITKHSQANRNNQDWHQDSNLMYGGRPMVTLWIPLQDGAGLSRPGLEWSELPIQYYSWKHGDGSSQALSDLSTVSYEQISTHSVSVERGSVIAFNGLTFHRTMVNKHMTRHRDALLIRFTNEENKAYFPGNREKDLSLEITSKEFIE